MEVETAAHLANLPDSSWGGAGMPGNERRGSSGERRRSRARGALAAGRAERIWALGGFLVVWGGAWQSLYSEVKN